MDRGRRLGTRRVGKRWLRGGVRFIDIEDPEHPTEVGALTAIERAEDVVVSGGFLCIAAYEAGLWLVHIQGPVPPTATPVPTPTALIREGLAPQVFLPLAARSPIGGRCH